MKRLDRVIVTLVAVNFVWFGFRIYFVSHAPLKRITSVSSLDVIGDVANLSGDSKAGLVIVEFGDYQCPPCARMVIEVEQFMRRNKGKFRFNFRQYPLPSHSYALPAAMLAERARKYGKFEAVHKSLFALQANLNEDSLKVIARSYGLKYSSGDNLDVDDKVYETIVAADKLMGNKIPVIATPSLFLCTADNKVFQLYDVGQAGEFLK